MCGPRSSTSPSAAIATAVPGIGCPTVPTRAARGRFSVVAAVLSVSPYPSKTVIPAPRKKCASCSPNGPPPLTAQRTPPSSARNRRYTSRSATACWARQSARTRPCACCCRLARTATLSAQANAARPGAEARITAEVERMNKVLELEKVRARKKLTQSEVAARMGLSQRRVSAIEHTGSGEIKIDTLRRYVESLGGRLEVSAVVDGDHIPLSLG